MKFAEVGKVSVSPAGLIVEVLQVFVVELSKEESSTMDVVHIFFGLPPVGADSVRRVDVHSIEERVVTFFVFVLFEQSPKLLKTIWGLPVQNSFLDFIEDAIAISGDVKEVRDDGPEINRVTIFSDHPSGVNTNDFSLYQHR